MVKIYLHFILCRISSELITKNFFFTPSINFTVLMKNFLSFLLKRQTIVGWTKKPSYVLLFSFLLSLGCTAAKAQLTVPEIIPSESRCPASGTVLVKGNVTYLNILTGTSIPQLGPFSGPEVLFDKLPKGTYTLTTIEPNSGDEATYTVVVPGNYQQNWFFKADVTYTPCSGGTPTVKISNFQITDAATDEQRPPYKFRISAKNGGLPADGTEPPTYQSVSEFSIPYPDGVGGTYEIQAMDACGNYKTTTINIPASAPGPSVSSNFIKFDNCDGDAQYKISASGGTSPYAFEVKSGPDQVGTVVNGNDATFTLKALQTYVFKVTDQCGGVTEQTVNVKPYTAPTVNCYNGYGKCDAAGGAGTGSVNVNIDLNTVSKGPVTVSLLSAAGCTQVSDINYPLDGSVFQVTFDDLVRPCTYTVKVTDGCGKIFTKDVSLVGPAPGVLQCYKSFVCPAEGSNNYILKIGTFGNTYNATVPLVYDIIDSTTNMSIAGYPISINNYAEIYPEFPKGKYYIKITDACGATCLDSVSVPQYLPPTVSADVNNKCAGSGQANIIGVNNRGSFDGQTYNYKIEEGPSRVGQGPEPDSPANTGQFSGLISGGTYKFSFNDGCKTVYVTVTVPTYEQPTWEVGFGALCPPSKEAALQIMNLQPTGKVVGPYKWRIISTDSDLYATTSPYNGTLPYPNSMGQTDSTFANLPAKGDGSTASYVILGNDGCKNSYLGTGKIGPLPDEDLLLNVTKVCNDGSSLLRARASIPVVGATYRFYRNGVKIAESKKLFTIISPALPGTYTIKVIASTLPDSSCFKSGSPTGIVVEPAGQITVTTPAPSCSDVPVDLNTTVAGSSAGTFTFFKDKAMTQAVANPTAVTVAQTYYIKLITSSAPICTIKDSVTITFKNCNPLGAIGDFVFLDNDGNNSQSPGDSPIKDVRVYLLNSIGTIIDSTFTDVDGKYLFGNLPAGTYSVQFVAPTAQSFVTPNVGGITKDSDAGVGGKSGQVTLAPVLNPITAADSAATFNFTLDAGIKKICVRPTIAVTTPPACSTDKATFSFAITTSAVDSVRVSPTTATISGSGTTYTITAASGVNVTVKAYKGINCEKDTTIAPPMACGCVTAPPALALGQNLFACKGDTFPTLKATIIGYGTVDWYKQATGGTAVATNTLTYKPAGIITANDTLYLEARNLTGTCPAVSMRTPVVVVAQTCIDTVDLALKKLISKKSAIVGDIIEYTIKVWNESNKNATGVEATDSLNVGVQYVSSSATRGSYDVATKKWTIGNVAANGDTVALTIKVKVVAAGVWFNTAEISRTDQKDKDSTPGNNKDNEDDIDSQCFSVPFKLCIGQEQRVQVSLPSKYKNVVWSDQQTGNVVFFNQAGTYTFTASSGTCPTGGCCPVVVESIDCCPKQLCVPFTVTRKRK